MRPSWMRPIAACISVMRPLLPKALFGWPNEAFGSKQSSSATLPLATATAWRAPAKDANSRSKVWHSSPVQ